MKRITCAMFACLLLSANGADASSFQGKSRGKKPSHQSAVNVQVVFAPHDVTIIRTHYAPQYRNLPPGLQKKVARGGALPPGWQKKLQPFPLALERQLPRVPAGYGRGVIDGHAVIYDTRTHVIVDVAILY